MDATCAIQASIHVFSLVRKYVSRILGTYHLRSSGIFVYDFIFLPTGTCANRIAANISTHPIISLPPSCSSSISHPVRTEKTDSRLIIIDASVGLSPFCPIICNVYATPHDITPDVDVQAAIPSGMISQNTIGKNPNIPHAKNCIHESLTPSTNGEK